MELLMRVVFLKSNEFNVKYNFYKGYLKVLTFLQTELYSNHKLNRRYYESSGYLFTNRQLTRSATCKKKKICFII